MGNAFFLRICLVIAYSMILSISPAQHAVDHSLVIGMDHIPLAVRDLDLAADFYKSIGFSIKPGRVHKNGIWNKHIKFRDGTELELITAAQARDNLTAEYYRFLSQGEGPAFWGLFAKDSQALGRQLEAAHLPSEREGPMITFPSSSKLHPLFFGGRNLSTTDKPEHFEHANSAFALKAVWLATRHQAEYGNLFQALGLLIAPLDRKFPFKSMHVAMAKLAEGEVIFFPAVHQVVKGHEIVGATISINSIDRLFASWRKAGLKIPRIIKNRDGTSSVYLSPDVTHGIWLEFRAGSVPVSWLPK